MLTYEQLFDTLRREKSRDELQVLDPDFYAKAQGFLARQQALISGDMSLASQRAQIECQNTQRILRELYDRRERKIVTLAMHKTRAEDSIVDIETLLPTERAFFDELVALLTRARKEIVQRAPITASTEDSSEAEPEAPAPGIEVRFTATVPKFVGKDMRVFGPYEEGQKDTLPEEIAQILVQKGRAQRI